MEDVFAVSQLLNDLSRWLLILVPLVGTVMVGYFALRRNMAADEQETRQWSRQITNTMVGTAIGLGASGIVSLIGNYVK